MPYEKKKKQLLHYKSWQVSVTTNCCKRWTCLDAIVISHWWVDEAFDTLQPMGIFLFLEKQGEIALFKRCLQRLYFSLSQPTTQSSLLFCVCVHKSRNSICAFNNGIKIQENRIEICEQSKWKASNMNKSQMTIDRMQSILVKFSFHFMKMWWIQVIAFTNENFMVKQYTCNRFKFAN